MNDSSNNASPCHTGTAQLLSEATDDFSLVLIPFFAELSAGDIPDKVRVLRFSALREVQRYLTHYRKLGIVPRLLCAIARKKGELISEISTKAEMERVVHPHVPHYDGSKFVPDEYMVPEEELICWSETSLRAPLNDAGFNRYMELFRQVMPDEYAAMTDNM